VTLPPLPTSKSTAHVASRERAEGELSLLGLTTAVLRRRRLVMALMLAGGLAGAAISLMKERAYTSSARFLPQGAEASQSGLAAAASQLGLRLPTTSAAWSPAVYVELLKSSALLEPVLRDTVTVAELGGQRKALIDMLEVPPGGDAMRVDRGLRALSGMVSPEELRTINAVRVSVTTPWPSVSQWIAARLLRGINEFNVRIRQSQASSERQFVDVQAAQAESTLRVAEERYQQFQRSNRMISSNSGLQLEGERLRREVDRRQQLYTSLLQSRDEARIREVRDTPVITVLENPRVPLQPGARGTVSRTVLGLLAGFAIGLVLALFAQALEDVRLATTDDAKEFLQTVRESTPRLLRR
jgi:tyrosine-protein kinase Etk/Wzc